MARTNRSPRVAALTALARALMRRPGEVGVMTLLGVVPRMLRSALTGRYPYLDHKRVGLAALGLLYIVVPVDVMPEAVLGLFGLGDDAVVAAFVAGALLSEAQAFLDWERADGERPGAEPGGPAGRASTYDATAHEPPRGPSGSSANRTRVVPGEVVDV